MLYVVLVSCFLFGDKHISIISVPAIFKKIIVIIISKISSEYDQEIPQSQTADNPVAPQGRAAQPS